MKLEKFKANNKRKIVIGVLLFVGIASAIFLNTSRAKYRTTQSIPLYRGKINYKPYDFKMMAMYQENDSGEYTEIETMPSSGYKINEEKSYCYTTSSSEIDTNAKLYTLSTGEHVIANLSKNSKCYLYFDVKTPSNAQEIIKYIGLGTGTPDFSKTSCSSGCGEATVGLYSAIDDDGISYYFRGDVENNYVKFANKYWRIIRINGDGSIRLIYDGTSARANGTSSTDTQIGTNQFNTNDNDNMYVGYMYTSGEVHGTGTSSTIKTVLDNWYKYNIETYSAYIDYNAGFCGDRTPYTNDTETTVGGGTGTTHTNYGFIIRYDRSGFPVLTCASSDDLYTTTGSTKGNKALTYPIGLISADEVWYAGGTVLGSSSYYLYTGQMYWTMTPHFFDGNYKFASMTRVSSYGALIFDDHSVSSSLGVRPVINLRADTKLKAGSLGTMDSPYIVEGAE